MRCCATGRVTEYCGTQFKVPGCVLSYSFWFTVFPVLAVARLHAIAYECFVRLRLAGQALTKSSGADRELNFFACFQCWSAQSSQASPVRLIAHACGVRRGPGFRPLRHGPLVSWAGQLGLDSAPGGPSKME